MDKSQEHAPSRRPNRTWPLRPQGHALGKAITKELMYTRTSGRGFEPDSGYSHLWARFIALPLPSPHVLGGRREGADVQKDASSEYLPAVERRRDADFPAITKDGLGTV